MKYPVLFGALLGGIILFSSLILAILFPVKSFLNDPFSTIMNIPNIMPYFTFFGSITGIFLALFIYSAFREYGVLSRKVKILLSFSVILGFVLVWSPYNDLQLFFKWLHTLSGLGLASGLIFLSFEFNKISNIKNMLLSQIKEKIPWVMGIGTLGIWLITGINMLMETYFFLLSAVWLLFVGITLKRK